MWEGTRGRIGAISAVEEQGGMQWNAGSVSGLSFLLVEWY